MQFSMLFFVYLFCAGFMSVTFSETLISRYKRYMQERHNVSISDEQAQIHLASLSQLYTSFSFSKKAGKTEEELSSHPHPSLGWGESSGLYFDEIGSQLRG